MAELGSKVIAERLSATILGVGLVLEDERSEAFAPLCANPSALARSNVKFASQIDPSFAAAKDRRFLAPDDLMAIEAARLALADAGYGEQAALDASTGTCIVWNAGKYTRELERDHPRTWFRNANGRFDSNAFDRAVDAGELVLDPFRLLRQLDNNVLWWLCKKYGFDTTNLQYTQVNEPDYFALIEAVAAIAFGEADIVLVGGVQLAAQSAPVLSKIGKTFVAENDGAAAGSSAFFVLGPCSEARQGLGTISYEVMGDPSTKPESSVQGTACLTHALLLLDNCWKSPGGRVVFSSRSCGAAPTLQFEGGA